MVFLFIFFWVLFIGARLAIFSLNMDIAVKKRIWPIVIIGLGAALLATAWLLHFPVQGFAILGLAVAAIIFVNLRGFYFCEACGRMVANKNILSKPEKCAKCGAALNR